MNITYTILRFEPTQREFIVSYRAEGASDEIALNLPLPLKDGAFMEGVELDSFISGFAPVNDFELERAVGGLDPLDIQSLIPSSTPEEIQRQYLAAIDARMSAIANARGYDSIESAAKYIGNTRNETWATEGEALRDWAVEVYETCYAILAQVMAGEVPMPFMDELLGMLPDMVWPDGETAPMKEDNSQA